MSNSGERENAGDPLIDAVQREKDSLSRSNDAPNATDTFCPFFIVGCQRSGTTALAVMFDRHSGVAVPSETQFFNGFVVSDRRKRLPMTHEQLLSRACDDFFIHQTGLRYEELIDRFRRYEPTYPDLFRTLLESYAVKQGKRRTAEKSCDHIFHVPELLRLYPKSKVICIVRDGRDVVQSMIAAWGPKMLSTLCRLWIIQVRQADHWRKTLPQDRFTVVKYGDLMKKPDDEMRRLCAFVGEDFEQSQINNAMESASVPAAEMEWKRKAMDRPDPSRVGAWRRHGDPERIAQMNYYMGSYLRRWGYSDTEVIGVSSFKRLLWWLQYIPCRRGIYPFANCANRALRAVRSLLGGHVPRNAEA